MSLRHRALPDQRRGALKRTLAARSGLRFLEAHNGLSAIVANGAHVERADGDALAFDGLWASSLTGAAAKGLPDAEIVGIASRLATIQEILDVTDKPLIVDGDTGGDAVHFEYLCSRLEAMGASAVVVEDQRSPKRNSLATGVARQLEDPEVFSAKLARGRAARLSDELMIVARIESLVANRGLDDALERAARYLDAGADGLMIHSTASSPEEILAFLRRYRRLCDRLGYRRPILCVPTTYNGCTERELFAAGADVAIHANHLLRASLHAMRTVARLVLEHGRSREADPHCATVTEVFDAVGFLDVEAKDARFGPARTRAIVLAAGAPGPRFRDDFGALPPAALELAGKSILQWQLEAFHRAGVAEAVVVTGYHATAIPRVAATFLTNPEFAVSKSLRTLMLAAPHMDDGFFSTVSDIVFTDRLVREMRAAGKDILLAIDDSPSFALKRRTKPTIDLVEVDGTHPTERVLDNASWTIRRIGAAVPASDATHEFAGLAFFSPRGAAIARAVHADAARRHPDRLAAADVTDLFQAIIDRGHTVHGFGVNSGWIEIQNAEDYAAAARILHAS